MKEDERIDSSFLKLEVLLDGLESTNHAQLKLEPIDKDVRIVQETYDINNNILGVYNVGVFKQDIAYNKQLDVFDIAIKTSFDVFIFNICVMLGIGKLTIDESVKTSENGFAPIEERVKTLSLSLEELKCINNFIGEFSLKDTSIDFKGLVFNVEGIHENVKDGALMSEVKCNLLKRSENLIKWD